MKIRLSDLLEEYTKSQPKKTKRKTRKMMFDIPTKCRLCGIGIGKSTWCYERSNGTRGKPHAIQHTFRTPHTLKFEGKKYPVDKECLEWAERMDDKTIRDVLKTSGRYTD